MAQLWLKRRFVLFLTMMIVVLSLATLACTDNGDGIGPSPTPTATRHPSPTATPNPSKFVVANPTATETEDGISLHLLGPDTSGARSDPLAMLGATCGSDLVFTSSSPTSLSSSVVQRIRSYLQNLPIGSNYNPYPSPSLSAPAGVNWIPNGRSCSVVLQVTNVTQREITITGFDLRLNSSPSSIPLPRSNYSQVDICSVICDTSLRGLGTYCDNAAVALGSGGNGSMYQAKVTFSTSALCLFNPHSILLLPGQPPANIVMNITVPSGTARAYQVVPELQVSGDTSSMLSFPMLKTNLWFAQLPASAQQWPCYGLLANPDRVVPDRQVPYEGLLHPVCV